MSREMGPDEWRPFLEQGTRTAKVATTRRDGRPHVVPVWFVLDGEDLVFTTGADSVKGRAVRRDGHVCVCVDDDRPPYAFVMVEGRATVSDDLEEMLRQATRIGGRYMGAERAAEFGRRNSGPRELLVRIRPERVVAVDGFAE
jgi:PPOX class probable F420-dependent enzyme